MYTPLIPGVGTDPVSYAYNELQRISEVLQVMQTERVSFVVLHNAPHKPREGDVIFADGTDWNPGSGRGLYQRSGSAWVILGGGGGGVTDHGALSGLADDDHPQYALESALGDAAGKNTGTVAGTVAAGDDSRFGAGGGATVFTQYEADLGSVPASNGSFTIAGTGLTVGKPVLIAQAATAYTGKGTYADEIEMDQITASGYVQNSTTIVCHWGSSTRVNGNVKFNYLVGA